MSVFRNIRNIKRSLLNRMLMLPVAALLVSLAQYGQARSGWELPYLTSSGAGVSSSSIDRALKENPAILAQNIRSKIFVGTDYLGGDDVLGYRGSFVGTSGMTAFGLGFSSLDVGGGADQLMVGSAGLAMMFSQLNFSTGVSVHYPLNVENADLTSDIGLVINPNGGFRLAATAYDIQDGIGLMGAGLTIAPSPTFQVIVDALTNIDGGLTLKPGLKAGVSSVVFMMAYGVNVETGAGGGTDELELGINIGLGQKIALGAYFNRYGRYAADLMMRF